LLLGLLMVPGVALVVSSTNFKLIGIFVALFSSMVAVTFSILNKDLVGKYNPITMTSVQLGTGFLMLSLGAPIFYGLQPDLPFWPVGYDWIYLSVLAFACTSFAYVITLRALKFLPTFTINLTINLEPVYSIIIAYYFLNEGDELGWGFYLGAFVIIASVFLHPIVARRWDRTPDLPEDSNTDASPHSAS
jgi:drug/metabolite transporter (DMT)-like permease